MRRVCEKPLVWRFLTPTIWQRELKRDILCFIGVVVVVVVVVGGGGGVVVIIIIILVVVIVV